MPNKTRLARINDGILREMAEILRSEIKDPRAARITSVTRVDTTNDLAYSKVYVSVLGGREDKDAVMAALKSASGFVRKEIASRLNLRVTPEFRFILDDSMEYGERLTRIIKEINGEGGKDD
jgi:ribosome-binding factor A